MNLIRDNYGEKKQNISVITIMVAVVAILIIVAILLTLLIVNMKNKTFKFNVDGQAKSISEQVFREVDGVKYINVKTIANLVNYEYNNGEYNNPYEEDKTKCYVKCKNEIASFIAGSNKMYKVVLESQDKLSETSEKTKTTAQNKSILNNIEYYELQNEVKVIDGEIYATAEAISIGFNIIFKYEKSINRVDIYTLPSLIKNIQNYKIENAVVGSELEFSNKKLVLYDMILVKNSSGEYGIKRISNQEAVLGTKYSAIKFIESSQNFIITTADGKQGISSRAGTKISPQYDELKQLDKNLDLYLVKNSKKYGVVNGSGQIVIYIEYDQIGMDTSNFINNSLTNQYILYEKYIPVKRDEKWGLMDLSGNLTLQLEYDSFGCTLGTNITKVDNNLLLVPDIKGIVVSKNSLYGLMTPEGAKLVPISLSEMYKTTNSGITTYYMTYNEQKLDVIEWVKNKTK